MMRIYCIYTHNTHIYAHIYMYISPFHMKKVVGVLPANKYSAFFFICSVVLLNEDVRRPKQLQRKND